MCLTIFLFAVPPCDELLKHSPAAGELAGPRKVLRHHESPEPPRAAEYRVISRGPKQIPKLYNIYIYVCVYIYN